jgi:hypothetical protein
VTGASICEPYRDYIEAQLRLKCNGMAVYQDLVDQFGFTGAFNSVKRFAKLRYREPEQPNSANSYFAAAARFFRVTSLGDL